MPIADNGDVIRGMGYVAIYAAYLEESIDGCMEYLIQKGLIQDDARRWQVSRKLKELKSCIESLEKKPSSYQTLILSVDRAKLLLECRNQLIHGRIYSTQQGDILKSSRTGVADREIQSGETYELANNLFELRDPFEYAHLFDLPRVL